MRWTEEQLLDYQSKNQTKSHIDRSVQHACRRPIPSAQSKVVYLAKEHDEQSAFVQWLRFHGIRHNSTPNGGHRAAKTAKYLKAEGVSPGFPDITVWPELFSGLPVLYIEMKRTKGGRPTDEQLEWTSYLSGLPNVRTAICNGAEAAIRFVVDTWGLTSQKEIMSWVCAHGNG